MRPGTRHEVDEGAVEVQWVLLSCKWMVGDGARPGGLGLGAAKDREKEEKNE